MRGFHPCRLSLLLTLLCLWAPGKAFTKTSPLAPEPDWGWVAGCAGSFTRSDFQRIFEGQYLRSGSAPGNIEVLEHSVRIRTAGDVWQEVPFANDGAQASVGAQSKPGALRFWRRASEMAPASAAKPLQGVKIAIDPGHLGGEWARMEERFFQMGKTRPVAEGDLTLSVAKKLKPALEKLGADVTLLRRSDRPVTADRSKTLRPAAEADLSPGFSPDRLRRHSELFFYRISEIRARAQLVNERIKPDMVLCLHFNAEEWGEPDSPQLQPRNHMHALVNGGYSEKELEADDIRSDMLRHVFSRVAEEAIPLCETVVEAMAEETGLPPFTYFSNNVLKVGQSPYLYARNLLANRLYHAPVVFLEPYVMNSQPVWKRVQMGDYSGQKLVDGQMRKSIATEYADGVVEGVARYYRQSRPAR